MQRFADGHGCRMVELVRHFGDQEDAGRPCGLCDVCDAPACLVRTVRAPKPREREAAQAILRALRDRDGQATGRLHTECASAGLERRDFEEVLGGLARAGLLRVTGRHLHEGRPGHLVQAGVAPARGADGRRRPRSSSPCPATAAKAPRPRDRPGPGQGKRRRGGAGRGEPRRPTRASWPRSSSGASPSPDETACPRSASSPTAPSPPSPPRAPRTRTPCWRCSGFGPGLLKRYGDRLLAFCRGAVPVDPPRSPAAPSPGRST